MPRRNFDEDDSFECYPKGRRTVCRRVYLKEEPRILRVERNRKLNPFRILKPLNNGIYLLSKAQKTSKSKIADVTANSVNVFNVNNKDTFKINEFITVKLQKAATMVYIKDKPFIQCMYLLMNLDKNDLRKYDQIESIDQAAESLGHELEQTAPQFLTARQEFIGHCSNLQAWAEHNYDSRLLHRNLAFPLLKALVEAGDPKAKRVFKDEIGQRLSSLYPPVVRYLLEENYLNNLSQEEIFSVINEDAVLKLHDVFFADMDKDDPREHLSLVKFVQTFYSPEFVPSLTLEIRKLKDVYFNDYFVRFEEISLIFAIEAVLQENRLNEIRGIFIGPDQPPPDLIVRKTFFFEYGTYNLEEVKHFQGLHKIYDIRGDLKTEDHKFYAVNSKGYIIGFSLKDCHVDFDQLKEIMQHISGSPMLEFVDLRQNKFYIGREAVKDFEDILKPLRKQINESEGILLVD